MDDRQILELLSIPLGSDDENECDSDDDLGTDFKVWSQEEVDQMFPVSPEPREDDPCEEEMVEAEKTQWIGINQIIEDLAFEASVAMFIGLIEDLQVQGQQGQHLTFHI
ncbi:hypothetical protein M8J77_000152 [Diaphorina citri]|nr:hypothetical protein M8J77_000152 [Diaphorina citri]